MLATRQTQGRVFNFPSSPQLPSVLNPLGFRFGTLGIQSRVENLGTKMKAHLLLLTCLSLPFAMTSIFLPAQAGSAQSDLIAAENNWVTAELRRDSGALSQLMSDDLVMTETDGSVIGKAQEIAFTADPDAHLELLEAHDMKVHMHGDTAVVTGAFHEKGTYHGKPFQHQGRFTDTWVRQKGMWQCIASQFSIPVQD
jgi:ketosteroid isomerase-like protein